MGSVTQCVGQSYFLLRYSEYFGQVGRGGGGVQAGAPRAILCPATQGRRPGYPAENESDIGGLKKMPFLYDLGYQGRKQ
jgi:hypothetical protein